MTRINGVVAVVLFAALTGVVALQVLNRMVLHLPLIWSEEVARFLFFWVVLLGAALSVRRRRHFVLDIAPGRRHAGTPRQRFLFGMVPDFCVLAFAIFLAVMGVGYTRTGVLRTATNSGLNMAVVYAALPVFAILTIVYSILNLLADYRTFRERAPEPSRAPGAE